MLISNQMEYRRFPARRSVLAERLLDDLREILEIITDPLLPKYPGMTSRCSFVNRLITVLNKFQGTDTAPLFDFIEHSLILLSGKARENDLAIMGNVYQLATEEVLFYVTFFSFLHAVPPTEANLSTFVDELLPAWHLEKTHTPKDYQSIALYFTKRLPQIEGLVSSFLPDFKTFFSDRSVPIQSFHKTKNDLQKAILWYEIISNHK